MVKIADYNKKPTTLGLVSAGEIFQKPRPYLGLSQIGHSCSRYLWYSFRWCYIDSFSPRVARLLNRGHREEECVIATLNGIGITVDSMQEEIVLAFGHGHGHIDGIAYNVPEAPKTPHLLEIKTMADKYFQDVVKKGVKVSKPVYYGQTQTYMKGMNLTRTLFIAVNKNNDDWYVERIRVDKDHGEDLYKKAESIVLSELPPIKPFSPTWFECRFCGANKVCHGGQPPHTSCRTCQHVDILDEGKWSCNKHSKPLSEDDQHHACDDYWCIL